MKYNWKYLSGCLLMLLLVACTQEETLPLQTPPGVAISVSAMERIDNHAQTRSLIPLKPEKENMIRTLSLLVFDDEGQHYIGHFDYYRYLSVADQTNPDGKLEVYEPEYGGTLTGKGTLCAVANMNQEDLLDAMKKKAAEGGGSNVLSLEDFKELSVDLPYINHSDSVGLVKDIYMFGYYAGELKPYQGEEGKYVTISLGRIISRLNVALSLDEEVEKANLSFAIRLGNTSRKAYIFPGKRSPEETVTDSYFAPVELAQKPSQFYYYVTSYSNHRKGGYLYRNCIRQKANGWRIRCEGHRSQNRQNSSLQRPSRYGKP